MSTEVNWELFEDPDFDLRTPEMNCRLARDPGLHRLYDAWHKARHKADRLGAAPEYPTGDALAYQRLWQNEQELADYCERNGIPLPLQIQFKRELEAALAEQRAA